MLQPRRNCPALSQRQQGKPESGDICIGFPANLHSMQDTAAILHAIEFQTAAAEFEGVADRSVPLNQATYNVGRKISVRIVATNKPPMIAKAIGPQNTVGAIGIMPRTVDTAVSMIGRKRELLASMAASQAFFP